MSGDVLKAAIEEVKNVLNFMLNFLKVLQIKIHQI
jgi:hypothetical protein